MPHAMRNPSLEAQEGGYEYPNGYPVAVNEEQKALMEARGWVEVTTASLNYAKMSKGLLLDEVERQGLPLPEKPTVANLRELLEADQAERMATLADTVTGGEPLVDPHEES